MGFLPDFRILWIDEFRLMRMFPRSGPPVNKAISQAVREWHRDKVGLYPARPSP
jgi:hypothetical protein